MSLVLFSVIYRLQSPVYLASLNNIREVFLFSTSLFTPTVSTSVSVSVSACNGLYQKSQTALLHFSNQYVRTFLFCKSRRTGFYSVVCSLTMFLATAKGKDTSNKYSQSSSTTCVLVYLACLKNLVRFSPQFQCICYFN